MEIEKHPHVIPSPNVSDSICVKVNSFYLFLKHLLQISVNDLIYQCLKVDLVNSSEDGRVCIDDTSLIKYVPKHINPNIRRNPITRRCQTCIKAFLLQCY